MKIQYKNFIIEDDRNGFVLSVLWVAEKWENIGKEYIKEQVYPSTLEACLLRIIKMWKLQEEEVVTIEEYIKQDKEQLQELLSTMKEILGNE